MEFCFALASANDDMRADKNLVLMAIGNYGCEVSFQMATDKFGLDYEFLGRAVFHCHRYR